MNALIRRLFARFTQPQARADNQARANNQARADWCAVKAAALLSKSGARIAEVQQAELAAHEEITDSYGHRVMLNPSAAVLNEFCMVALAQVPHLLSALEIKENAPKGWTSIEADNAPL